jgi:SWI/SNF-related matrix-associated actin-dependent regulator 1 of chromatin subfamily A
MKQHVREAHKKAFINNPEYRVIIGTVGALGVSHTLTVARNVIFYDSPWTPADIEQCEDRCYRPGTQNAVNIYTLIVKDTVDETVHEILSKKEGTSQYIVDNNIDLKRHPELLNLLLQDK